MVKLRVFHYAVPAERRIKERKLAQAKEGDKVKVNYTGRFDNGEVFDSSAGRTPLEFTVGAHQVIPGFEGAVVGMNPGESKTINIPADEAYGPHYDEMVMKVDRSEFPEDMKPGVGDHLQLQDPNGDTMIVTVTEADDNSVTLDGNHPLAGKDLTFDIELLEVA
jgi:peptidylprolyl isomerase